MRGDQDVSGFPGRDAEVGDRRTGGDRSGDPHPEQALADPLVADQQRDPRARYPVAGDPARLAGERKIACPPHPGHADGVRPIRQPYRTNRLRPLDPLRERTVRNRRAAADIAQFLPHASLKRRTCRLDRQIVNGVNIALEVAFERFPQTMWIARRHKLKSALAVIPRE